MCLLHLVISLQLFVTGLPGSLIGALSGVVAGMVYRSKIFNLSEMEAPAIITHPISRIIALFDSGNAAAPAPPSARVAAV